MLREERNINCELKYNLVLTCLKENLFCRGDSTLLCRNRIDLLFIRLKRRHPILLRTHNWNVPASQFNTAKIKANLPNHIAALINKVTKW